jgi:hypothetical protein
MSTSGVNFGYSYREPIITKFFVPSVNQCLSFRLLLVEAEIFSESTCGAPMKLADNWTDARVILRRLATEPCSKLPGLENFVPYVSTRYFGIIKPRTRKKQKTVERPIDVDAVDLAPPDVDVMQIVSRLPAENGKKLTDAQRELIEAFTWLANTIARKRAARHHVHMDDMTSAAIEYLTKAVTAGPVGETAEEVEKWIGSKIDNGLAYVIGRERKHRKVVEPDTRKVERTNEHGEVIKRESGTNRMDTLVEGHAPKLNEAPTDWPQTDEEYAKIQSKLALRERKDINLDDVFRRDYEQIKPGCEGRAEFEAVAFMVLAGDPIKRIAADLKTTRHAVLEIARILAA